MAKSKTVKEDGNYDGRNKQGRQSKGKGLHPKKTEKDMDKAIRIKRNMHGK